MRPWRSTWVASTTSRAAPELASMPRCVRCQSLATPSLALYWHIGDTTIRFESVRSASLIGENNALGIGLHMGGGNGLKGHSSAQWRSSGRYVFEQGTWISAWRL